MNEVSLRLSSSHITGLFQVLLAISQVEQSSCVNADIGNLPIDKIEYVGKKAEDTIISLPQINQPLFPLLRNPQPFH